MDKVGNIITLHGRRYNFIPRTVTTDSHSPGVNVEGIAIPIVDCGSFVRTSLRKNTSIKKVIFNDPATIVIWSDDSKTVVKCQSNDTYSKELGLAMCIAKKYLGNTGNYNEVFKKWIPKEDELISDIPVEDMRKTLKIYCHGRGFLGCNNCPPHSPVCRCGCNTYFTTKKENGSHDMTDDEIRNAYEIVFGK
jgi:hypothetical protein